MGKEELLELIMGYKKSSAFMTAYETGILERLHSNSANTQELSEATGMNPDYLSIFLLYLSSMNLVKEQEGKWMLTEDLESSYAQLQTLDGILSHEKNIYQRWMYPERLEQSLKSETGKREFDQIGFSKEEKKLYDQTMYGSNLKVMGLRIYRELRAFKNPLILEYGKSKGAVLQALKGTGYPLKGYYMSDESIQNAEYAERDIGLEILTDLGREQRFDVIILYNIIHYFDKNTFQSRISMLKEVLKDHGRILIIDLFYQRENLFSSNILLDWLTHGGVYLPTIQSLEEELEGSPFRIIRFIPIREINCSIIVMGVPEKKEEEDTV